MGMEVHDNVYKHAMESGKDAREAMDLANEAASSFLTRTRLWVVTDAMQLSGIFRGVGKTRGAPIKQTETALKNRAYQKLVNPSMDNPLINMGKEYIEEVGQFGMQAGAEATALGEGDYVEAFVDGITSAQAQLEGIMGMVGAGMQRVATNAATGKYAKGY
jgi:hypothetical protein